MLAKVRFYLKLFPAFTTRFFCEKQKELKQIVDLELDERFNQG
jgi:hypothetical protein